MPTHWDIPGKRANYSKLTVCTFKNVRKKPWSDQMPHFNAFRMNWLKSRWAEGVTLFGMKIFILLSGTFQIGRTEMKELFAHWSISDKLLWFLLKSKSVCDFDFSSPFECGRSSRNSSNCNGRCPSRSALALTCISRQVQDGIKVLLWGEVPLGPPCSMPDWRGLPGPSASRETLCSLQDQACRLYCLQNSTLNVSSDWNAREMSGDAVGRALVRYCFGTPESH